MKRGEKGRKGRRMIEDVSVSEFWGGFFRHVYDGISNNILSALAIKSYCHIATFTGVDDQQMLKAFTTTNFNP